MKDQTARDTLSAQASRIQALESAVRRLTERLDGQEPGQYDYERALMTGRLSASEYTFVRERREHEARLMNAGDDPETVRLQRRYREMSIEDMRRELARNTLSDRQRELAEQRVKIEAGREQYALRAEYV